MSTTTDQATTFRGNDKLLVGLIFSILTFWLFAQSMGMMSPSVLADLNGFELGTSPDGYPVVSPAVMNLAVSVTAMCSGMFIVLFGGFADKYGRVKLALVGNVVSIVACVLLIVANGALAGPMVLTARALQGLSGALVMPSTLALVNTYWEGPARQRAVSMWSIGSFGGAALASFVSGLLVTNFGWRSVFVLSIVVAVVAILLVRGTPENKVPAHLARKADPPGIILFMIMVLSLMIITTFGAQLGWTSVPVLALFATLIVSTIVFWIVEHKVDVPFIDFALFRNRSFTGAVLANFVCNSSIGLIMVSQQLFQLDGRMTSQQAGLLTLGYAFCVIAFVRLGEKVLQKTGPRFPMLLSLVIMAVGILAFMPTNLYLDQYKWFAIIGYTCFGIALALFATPATDTAMSNLPKEQSGAGAGIFKMASSLGSAIGAAVSLTLFSTMRPASGYEWISALVEPIGRQDNIDIRHAANFSFTFHLIATLVAIMVVLAFIPKGRNVKVETPTPPAPQTSRPGVSVSEFKGQAQSQTEATDAPAGGDNDDPAGSGGQAPPQS